MANLQGVVNPKLYRQVTLTTIPYGANTLVPFKLPNGFVYRSLLINFSGTLNTGATVPSGMVSQSIYKLIKTLEVTLNGVRVRAVPGWYFAIQNALDFTVPTFTTPIPSTLAINSTYPFEGNLIVPFCLTRAVRPVDTWLDLRNGSDNAYLNIQWGNDVNDIFGTVNGATFTNVQMSVVAELYNNVAPNVKAGLVENSLLQETITAANSDLEILLETNKLYRRVLIYTETSGIATNGILNIIKLSSTGYEFKNWKAHLIQVQNASYYHQTSVPTGVYELDMTTDGRNSEMLNTMNANANFRFVFDVNNPTGNNLLYIIPETLI